ncbi:hypothetical protein FOZ63_010405 [Perkinsus olseni]|nr:hypothetical protein FOZ63_010405 [Perkinsus olseni]
MRATLFIGLVGVVQQKKLLCFPTDLYNPHQSNIFTFAPPSYSDCVNCYSSPEGRYYIGSAVKGHDRVEVETVGMCVPKTCLQWEIKLLGKTLDSLTAFIDLREISPDCRIPSIAGKKRVAVCIEGPFGRADLNVLDSIRQNVVRPLNADALLVTDFEKGSNSTLDGVLELITLGVGEVHAYDIREDITPAEAVDEFFSEGGSRRVLDDAGMTGRELLNLREKLRCLELIEKVEKSSSARFDDVVYTRIDLMWLAEHPPQEVLAEAVASPTVWVPDSEDWRGLNDRAAFMPRQLADIYFNRYEAFINGVAAEYFYGMNGMAVTRGEVGDEIFDKIDFSINPEMILRRHLTHHRVRVKRYPTVAAVAACQAGRQCIGKPAPLSNGFRFAAEQAVARGNAYLLKVLGWRWSLEASTKLSPPCFATDDDRRHCCSEAAFYGRTLCYLDGTYSFDRCCKSMVIGLRKVDDDDHDTLPLCIDVADVNLCYHWKWLDSSCVACKVTSELSDGPLPSTMLSEESEFINPLAPVARFTSQTDSLARLPSTSVPIRPSGKAAKEGDDSRDLNWRVTETRMLSLQIDFSNGGFLIDGTPLILHLDHPTAPGETGLRVWDAGICMAKYWELKLEEVRKLRKVDRLRILELGCGSGVVGLACCLTSTPCDVLLSDRAVIKPRTQLNISANAAAIAERGNTCSYKVIDWTDLDNAEYDWTATPPPDLVIASDVLWSHVFVKPFVAALLKACPDATTDLYICQKARNNNLDDLWMEEVSRHFEDMLSGALLRPITDAAIEANEMEKWEKETIWKEDDAEIGSVRKGPRDCMLS